MSFLTGLAAGVVEWLLTKLFAIIGKDYADWQAQRKSNQAIVDNQTALQNAEKTGDKDAIAAAGQSALNNDGGGP